MLGPLIDLYARRQVIGVEHLAAARTSCPVRGQPLEPHGHPDHSPSAAARGGAGARRSRRRPTTSTRVRLARAPGFAGLQHVSGGAQGRGWSRSRRGLAARPADRRRLVACSSSPKAPARATARRPSALRSGGSSRRARPRDRARVRLRDAAACLRAAGGCVVRGTFGALGSRSRSASVRRFVPHDGEHRTDVMERVRLFFAEHRAETEREPHAEHTHRRRPA